MYASFFGLTQAPFSIAPDPRLLFMSDQHREALAHLLYGLGAGAGKHAGTGGGFVLLTGEIGTGKTTVCRLFLEQVPAHCNVAYIFNPRLTAIELLQSICDEFRIAVPQKNGQPPTVKDYLDPLNAFLLESHAAGRNSVLIIDEAQKLSARVLEQLRLLTNLETNERKLLQIVLIGQPELRALLKRPELEQLAQRVIARYHLRALNEGETMQYIHHRLEACGLERALPFDGAAMRRIHQLTGGVPRRINLLCDRALLGAFAKGQPLVNARTVEQAAAEVFDPPAADRPLWHRSLALVGLSVAAAALLVVAIRVFMPAPAGVSAATAGAAAATKSAGAEGANSVPAPRPVVTAIAEAPSSAARPAADRTDAVAAMTAAAPATPGSSAAPSGASDVTAMAAAASLPAPTGIPQATPAAAPAAVATPVAVAPRLHADEAQAWRELAGAWKVSIEETGKPCQLLPREQVHCFSGKMSLSLIRQLARPGIVTLDAASGAPSYALLTGLGANSATLRAGDSVQTVTLAALASRWQGDFATLWRAPEGYESRLGPRQRDTALQWVATQLALAADRPAPARVPAEAALTAQLKAFQLAQGLPVNGQVGPLVFMQLNRMAGVEEPRLRIER